MASKFVLKLLRSGLAKSFLPSLDEFDVIGEPVFTRPSFLNTINELKVSYSKREEGSAAIVLITHIVLDDIAFHVLTSDGRLWSAGVDGGGCFLQGEYADEAIDLIAAITDVRFSSIWCNWESRCGVDASGQVWFWGSQYGPEWGCGYVWPGIPTCPNSSPIAIEGGGTPGQYIYVKVAASWPHAVGVTTAGKIYGWGFIDDTWDPAGLGGTYPDTDVIWPVQEVTLKTDWVDVFAGKYASAAIDSSGYLWVTGDNNYGRLGLGHDTHIFQFTKVGSKTDWVWAGFGEMHMAALDASGDVWVWGDNYSGQLGSDALAEEEWSPVLVDPNQYGNKSVVQVSCGIYNTYILCGDGTLYVTGENGDGECGLGHTTDIKNFTPITSHLFTMVQGGMYNAMGVTSDNKVYYWGWAQGLSEVHVPTEISWLNSPFI